MFLGGYHTGYNDGIHDTDMNQLHEGGSNGSTDALIQKVGNLPYEMIWIPSTSEYGNGSYAVNYYGHYIYALLYDDNTSNTLCINLTRTNVP